MNIFPNRLKIFVTESCNLNCAHCYLGDKTRGNIDLGLFEARVSEAKDLGVKIVDLTGGEPSVHPYFMEILNVVGKFEFEKINLSTNGLFLNERKIAREIARRRIHCNISLDGVDSSIVDRIRGKDVFAQLISAFKILREFEVNFSLRFSLNRSNFNQVEKMILFANFWKVNADLEITQLSGNATDADILRLEDVDEVRRILKGLNEEAMIGIEECFTAKIPCDGGQSDILAIDLNGEVVACLAIDRLFRRNQIVTLKREPLFEAWMKIRGHKTTLREFRPVLKRCACCNYLGVCQSGCCITAVSQGCLNYY